MAESDEKIGSQK